MFLQVAPEAFGVVAFLVVVGTIALLLREQGPFPRDREDRIVLADGTVLDRAEREAVAAARRYVLDGDDPVSVQQLRTEVFPSHAAGYRSSSTWWEAVVGPGLAAATDLTVPRDGAGNVAPNGQVGPGDEDPDEGLDLGAGGDPTPADGDRFGHAVRDRPGRTRVEVSDGERLVVLDPRDDGDFRVVSWTGEDVDVDWLADAREYARESVPVGELAREQ